MSQVAILNMDRLSCIANEFLRIVDSKMYLSATIVLSDTELHITPISESIKIVIKKEAK